MDPAPPNLLQLTADIVSAHAARNELPQDALLALIRSVYAALDEAGAEPATAMAAPQEPAVPIRKSVFPDYIVCLEDGKKLKMLKRHLQTAFSMTVDDYRAKWSLPPSYPMVAPNYAQTRSKLAKKIGLGRKPAALPDEPTVQKVAGDVSARRRKTKAAA